MADKVVRHAGPDRLIHWLIAASVLVLLTTGFLPIIGVDFDWVAIHWWTGFVLAVAVLAHVLRVLWARKRGPILPGPRDVSDALAVARKTFRGDAPTPPLPGKYSVSQKLIHLAFSIVVLAAIATGGMLMVKVDTPWWERNPYWISDGAWGIVYVVHGFSALVSITLVMTHVYFALRPEKALYLRAMIAGSITRAEYQREHDPERWRVGQ
jgi:cytochrome b subunit of formate dehydrogenase